jgi:GNAT superfamily N-acetyltransferase
MDRLRLCWGHLDDWRNLEIVHESKKWLEKTNTIFTPTTFIAYKNGLSVGMMEFIPHRLLNRLGLCPCRVDEKNNETAERYVLSEEFQNYLFISCFLVGKEHQHKGVGKALLNRFLNSGMFENSDGALVYVTPGDENWAPHIHWPAGPKEFYLKAGFLIERTLNDPKGYLLSYRNTAR